MTTFIITALIAFILYLIVMGVVVIIGLLKVHDVWQGVEKAKLLLMLLWWADPKAAWKEATKESWNND